MRTPLSELHERRSKPLHRTLPCWSRKVRDSGDLEWTLYVPHRMGGAVYVIETFGPETPRKQVATVLRERRRMLWGRDRIAEDKPVKARVPAAEKSAPTDPSPEAMSASATPQEASAVDDAQESVETLSLASLLSADGDDLPPWREDDEPVTEPGVYAGEASTPEPSAQAQLGFAF